MMIRNRDEHYVIDLCDEVLSAEAVRQHRFPFLTGDPGRNGICHRLPVDAFYPSLKLVVEYRERQHREPVKVMDRRWTISGCTRGEQRRRYDERRRIVLPRHGIELVELNYSMFSHDSRNRLRRDDRVADLSIVSCALSCVGVADAGQVRGRSNAAERQPQ